MRAFEQMHKASQQKVCTKRTKDIQESFGHQSTIGNKADESHGPKSDLIADPATPFVLNFKKIPVHSSKTERRIHPKITFNAPRDAYEQNADQVADWSVKKRSLSVGDNENEGINLRDPGHLQAQIESGSNSGKTLDTSINEEMSSKLGFDFSNVRIHTDDIAIRLSKGFNARAFTHGSDIYFNKGEYNTNSLGGKRLLAHELTHVVQQSQMTDKIAQRGMIQCTSIGQILDNFFSPFSSETLWIMPENDSYTRIVRTWQPVIDAVNRAKASLEADCAGWQTRHMTTSSWRPGMTDPPETDPNALGIWVSSPPGTDPNTCRDAFIIYVLTKMHPGIPTVQTFGLYTCSIGSFGIYATVDRIDCMAKTARMNIWMYNAMDRDSFGRYASHPLFAASGMERQYMWWNWSEYHRWGPVPFTPAPAPGMRPPTMTLPIQPGSTAPLQRKREEV
jgi:hypothetical protein